MRRRTRRSTSPGATTSVAPNSAASSRWCWCLATTITSPAGVRWRSASVAKSPTEPAPLTRTRSLAAIPARRAVCTAHASGSISTACSSEYPSGTGCSWLRCATSCWPQPPPVSWQKPVCRPAERWPTVTLLHRLVAPAAQDSQASTPRVAQVSTGSSTTRVPRGRSSQSSRSSATTSCPGTNGSETTEEK